MFDLSLNELAGRDTSNLSYPDLKKASSFSSTPEQRFDYIIVGGGTAGCPLAATLSENYRVLLLERGGSPYGNGNISYLRNFHISLLDDSPNSPSQPFISTDGVINSRARVLGGGTCINAGFYSRASSRYVSVYVHDSIILNLSFCCCISFCCRNVHQFSEKDDKFKQSMSFSFLF